MTEMIYIKVHRIADILMKIKAVKPKEQQSFQ
jgi:hypothetical protein